MYDLSCVIHLLNSLYTDKGEKESRCLVRIEVLAESTKLRECEKGFVSRARTCCWYLGLKVLNVVPQISFGQSMFRAGWNIEDKPNALRTWSPSKYDAWKGARNTGWGWEAIKPYMYTILKVCTTITQFSLRDHTATSRMGQRETRRERWQRWATCSWLWQSDSSAFP